MRAHPLADIFPLMDAEGLAALADDIAKHGLREAIVTFDGMILDGRNRLAACERAGVSPRFSSYEGDDPLAFVLSLNLQRRHLNESQRAMIAARLETMKWGRPQKETTGITRAAAAERLNVAPRTVARAAVVEREAAPELRAAVDAGKLAVSAAAQAVGLPPERQAEIAARAAAGESRAAATIIKQDRRAAREAELGKRQCALPGGRFGVILADPEWRFEPWSRETGMDRAADNHYPTSPTEAIAARMREHIERLAAPDFALLMWATNPMLMDALRIIDALAPLGVVYKTCFGWAKDRIGTGYWNRERHEHLLLATRGAIPAPAMGEQWDSLIAAPAGEHSKKPEVFLEMIEQTFPHLPKIELNRIGPARAGWSAWGNEAEPAEAADPAAQGEFDAALAALGATLAACEADEAENGDAP
jgi:N6-adenosine-specific RNA methylase IME4